MNITQVNEETNTSKYVLGVLSTPERKTCPNIAKALDSTHDKIYRCLDNPNERRYSSIDIAKESFGDEPVIMMLDDTRINKQYSEEIEGAEEGLDASNGQYSKGLQLVTALLTDHNIKIPVDIEPYIGKWLIGEAYATKSEIAKRIVEKFIYKFNIDCIIADAHYATKCFITFLFEKMQSFLMKLPRNRSVQLNNKSGQLQVHLRLRRNERVRCKLGLFEGLPCYFYVIKYDKDTTIYLISSDYIDPHNVYKLYALRWKIEIFYRTSKQLLGLEDCQARSLDRQLQHARFIMHAYALADVRRHRMNFSCTEEAIRSFRITKPHNVDYAKA